MITDVPLHGLLGSTTEQGCLHSPFPSMETIEIHPKRPGRANPLDRRAGVASSHHPHPKGRALRPIVPCLLMPTTDAQRALTIA